MCVTADTCTVWLLLAVLAELKAVVAVAVTAVVPLL